APVSPRPCQDGGFGSEAAYPVSHQLGAGCSGGQSLGEAADGKHSDVIFLAEGLGGVRDIEGGLAAEVVHAVKAEQLSGRQTGFDDAIAHKQDAVAGMQVETNLVVRSEE